MGKLQKMVSIDNPAHKSCEPVNVALLEREGRDKGLLVSITAVGPQGFLLFTFHLEC